VPVWLALLTILVSGGVVLPFHADYDLVRRMRRPWRERDDLLRTAEVHFLTLASHSASLLFVS
jgi:hypothetical protein